MKTSYIVLVAIVVLGLGGLIWHAASRPAQEAQPADTAAMQATTTDSFGSVTSSKGSVQPAQSGSGPADTSPAAPAAKHFAVNGNDATADLKTITINAGTPVTIVFGADAGSTYHGGLDFRSSVVSTGTIAPGSTKAVTFTAMHSFSFTPYWPATNIAKPYTIDVVVK